MTNPTPLPDTTPATFGPWAMKLIGMIVGALLIYSTVSNERLQTKLVEFASYHAVNEERWRAVDRRLEKIEATLDKLAAHK